MVTPYSDTFNNVRKVWHVQLRMHNGNIWNNYTKLFVSHAHVVQVQKHHKQVT